MKEDKYMPNRLIHETSPYLLQHANNPVNWYSWCDAAFLQAETENKPIFLSIGYSTCHWCHVMAHETFEDMEVADILNENFISIKLDKEERPDIDSIYMGICQAYTGSGGWPTSIFMTSEQKPFFAGTYFPKNDFINLLLSIIKIWNTNKNNLIRRSDEVIERLNNVSKREGFLSNDLINEGIGQLKYSFDKTYGGFGNAPKFPTPHNLMFLMNNYEQAHDEQSMEMVEKTLLQMYKGGIFDHIGFGFSRYSTDKYFLAPHFEKMAYDNALLISCYIKAFDITKNKLYRDIAVKIATFVLREMTDSLGGFYSAQDADSDGIEGKYYVFDYDEIIDLLGEDTGEAFNDYYGITKGGNFEGKNIPNLLSNLEFDNSFECYLPKLQGYRKSRNTLHLDDKILTSWNALMISAFAMMYRVLGDNIYLETAINAYSFIDEYLSDKDTLYVSYRNGKRGTKGFLDDYASYIYALINMYESTLEQKYLDKAIRLNSKALRDFYDDKNGGFYLYGIENEALILKPKETYDGAMPSGNSVMAYNLVKLSQITDEEELKEIAENQLKFMSAQANEYPMGYSFYLLALSMFLNPPVHIICVLKEKDIKLPLFATIKILDESNAKYPLINDKTTFYVCKDKHCKPPTNNLQEVL